MTRRLRPVLFVMLVAACVAPPQAAAQQADDWRIDFAPFYLWAASTEGTLSAASATLPIALDFSDAKDNLSGAFSFHVEASKGRWGLLTDLLFLRLSSGADFTVGAQTVTGNVELDNTIFELGASYLAHEKAQLGIIGGLRTYTLAPALSFTALGATVTPVDVSQTSANAFVGVTLRPKLSDRWMLVSRADIGGGDAELTWSAEAGLAFRIKRWIGLAFGYKGLGIDIQRDDLVVKGYDVVQHGPFFGLDFHWGR
jgi:hypothetical protein